MSQFDYGPYIRAILPRMATTHITIRTQPADPFDDLAERLHVNRTEALRIAARALMRTPALLEQARAEVETQAFVARLMSSHPRHAALRVRIGRREPDPRITWPSSNVDGVPVDSDELDVRTRNENGTTFVDLVDPKSGFGLRGAWWTETGNKEALIPLKAINVPTPLTGEAPNTVTLPDGRLAIEKREEDGAIKRYVLDDDGRARLLPPDQRAERFFQANNVD
jgi:hypothetical protein